MAFTSVVDARLLGESLAAHKEAADDTVTMLRVVGGRVVELPVPSLDVAELDRMVRYEELPNGQWYIGLRHKPVTYQRLAPVARRPSCCEAALAWLRRLAGPCGACGA
jgi:hypothetical protein